MNTDNKNTETEQCTIRSVVKSFYCQKPKQLKKMPKCEWQCGLCATFEGKRQ